MWFIPFIRRSTELNISRGESSGLMEKNTFKGFSISRLSDTDSRYFEYETIRYKNYFWTRSIFTDMYMKGFVGTIVHGKIEEKEGGIRLKYGITANLFTSLLLIGCLCLSIYYAIALFEQPATFYYWFLMIAPYSLLMFSFNQDATDDVAFMDALINQCR